MRRIFAVGLVVFIAAVFTLAVLTAGEGGLFVASVVSAAGVLIALVVVAALPGKRESGHDGPVEDFAMFEEASRHALRGGLVELPRERDADATSSDRDTDSARSSARAFVKTLVPAPRTPPALATAGTRSEFLEALRTEARGLIRLAKVTGVDINPYSAILADARGAAVRGDGHATLRALQLGNELLRAAIEKHLVKRRAEGHRVEDLTDF